jgi:hypothetical protein
MSLSQSLSKEVQIALGVVDSSGDLPEPAEESLLFILRHFGISRTPSEVAREEDKVVVVMLVLVLVGAVEEVAEVVEEVERGGSGVEVEVEVEVEAEVMSRWMRGLGLSSKVEAGILHATEVGEEVTSVGVTI